MRTGTANLPLHGGKCPAWLFTHMKALSAAIVEVIIEEAGTQEVLRRLSDPYWFQALGCVVGFDWHSSGVTTTVCGALKEGLTEIGPAAGLFLAGGKGKVSRQTPQEITAVADRFPVSVDAAQLVRASKLAARVDNNALQDGYQIYHHCFVFNRQGNWAVIQQGMNEDLAQARRYHWLSTEVRDFTDEPQAAICCDSTAETLNLVGHNNEGLRLMSSQLALEHPDQTMRELRLIDEKLPLLTLPQAHAIPRTAYLNRALRAAYEEQPQNFEALLQVPGVGAGTLRALCLVAEVAYGMKPSFADPVRYAFAHGGKDGFPFPVNERDIENSYHTLNRALRKARSGQREQLKALRNLARWHSEMLQISATSEPQIENRSPSVVPAANRAHTEAGKAARKSSLFQPGLF